jgi:hypothetical protein
VRPQYAKVLGRKPREKMVLVRNLWCHVNITSAILSYSYPSGVSPQIWLNIIVGNSLAAISAVIHWHKLCAIVPILPLRLLPYIHFEDEAARRTAVSDHPEEVPTHTRQSRGICASALRGSLLDASAHSVDSAVAFASVADHRVTHAGLCKSRRQIE